MTQPTPREALIRAASKAYDEDSQLRDGAIIAVIDATLAAIRSGLPDEMQDNKQPYTMYNAGWHDCLAAVTKSLDDLSV